MKTTSSQRRRSLRGFTLVELLVVISIIAILASLLIPTVAKVKVKAQVAKARVEISSLEGAIASYNAHYNRYPSSRQARAALNDTNPDFTFGTIHVGGDGNRQLLRDKRGNPLVEIKNFGQDNWQASNAEIVGILRGYNKIGILESYANPNHVQNPDKIDFLSAKTVSGVQASGIGDDSVYRDPWGNPYIVTVDLNYDGKCIDGFYRLGSVSLLSGQSGFHGLFAGPGQDGFAAKTPIMIWSLGPDGAASSQVRADKGVNRDNVLSW